MGNTIFWMNRDLIPTIHHDVLLTTRMDVNDIYTTLMELVLNQSQMDVAWDTVAAMVDECDLMGHTYDELLTPITRDDVVDTLMEAYGKLYMVMNRLKIHSGIHPSPENYVNILLKGRTMRAYAFEAIGVPAP